MGCPFDAADSGKVTYVTKLLSSAVRHGWLRAKLDGAAYYVPFAASLFKSRTVLLQAGIKSAPSRVPLNYLKRLTAMEKRRTLAHVVIGQWLTYAVILLHIGATGWHVAVRRDGVLFRMLPEQRTATDIAARVHNARWAANCSARSRAAEPPAVKMIGYVAKFSAAPTP